MFQRNSAREKEICTVSVYPSS